MIFLVVIFLASMGKYWLIGLACVDCSDCAVAIGIQAMGIKDDARNFFGLIYFAI